MAKPLHHYLPNWAHDSIKTKCCSQCEKKFSKSDIVAVGIRQTTDDSSAMYIEHKCSSCDFRGITTLGKHKEDTVEGLCCVILECIKKKKLAEKSRSLRKQTKNTPMTDKEVKSFLDFINQSKSYEDFLKEIGAQSPDDKKDSG